ncbi:hypothetical protein FDC58_07875 [Clostridium botulinum]|uniref:hypothetical protein n=1 Tax=Clostridium sp. ZBS14 TaxID=2949970 RepID=UPI000503A476|nr:hypothetical protein [Clostridium sp. ZBS14]KFX60182.1 hypothetical protein KU41_01500 [Clostridium botulinum]MBY6805003.1 hypothetical protein [Clostridium botulinum]MBY6815109.1 hypothetical protein [Clostridium botulinum]MBY6821731.1 hypothetical protein [Clostridium botulinum]NFI57158.1 hypothetical protein [Clostridium botulinum]
MTNYLKNEIKKTLFSKRFIIASLIVFLSIIIPLIKTINIGFTINEFKQFCDGNDAFILARTDNILIIIAPLIATIIYSDSYLIDKQTGFLSHIYEKFSKRKYIQAKCIANCICSGLAIALPSLIALFIFILLLGFNNTTLNQIVGPFSFINDFSKTLYSLFLILLSFIFNSLFAMLGLGVSPWLKNKYLTFLFPFFYYINSAAIFPRIWLQNLNATFLFEPNLVVTEFDIILYQIGLLIVGVLLFYLGVIKNHEETFLAT